MGEISEKIAALLDETRAREAWLIWEGARREETSKRHSA
jgi:hypothetical protein